MTTTPAPVKVGLVGSGHWASTFHAPLLAGGDETTLAGVWARRPEAAREIADAQGTVACDSFSELLDSCDAVAFAVTPDVQAQLAVQAAEAGKGLLLEKPLAFDVAAGREVVKAVEHAGVGTLTCLTFRFNPNVAAWLDGLSDILWHGGRAVFACPAFIAKPYASAWRTKHGALLELGPHVVDMLEAVLGRVTTVHARGSRTGTAVLSLGHTSGATSSVVLSAAAKSLQLSVDVYGETSVASTELVSPPWPDVVFDELRRAFAETVRSGGGHPLDAAHNLHLLEVLAEADAQLTTAD